MPPIEHLRRIKEYHIAAYNWGLVSTKIQTIWPWDSWVKRYTNEPAISFHDNFRRDGMRFSAAAVQLIRNLTGHGTETDR